MNPRTEEADAQRGDVADDSRLCHHRPAARQELDDTPAPDDKASIDKAPDAQQFIDTVNDEWQIKG